VDYEPEDSQCFSPAEYDVSEPEDQMEATVAFYPLENWGQEGYDPSRPIGFNPARYCLEIADIQYGNRKCHLQNSVDNLHLEIIIQNSLCSTLT
jgi:hypothetical protein